MSIDSSTTPADGPAAPDAQPSNPPQDVSAPPRKNAFAADWRQLPLEAYSLLGLPPLETDSRKILAAVARTRKHGRGDRPESPPAMARLDRAIDFLTDPKLKSFLDAALRRKAAGGKPRPDSSSGQEVECRHCQRRNPGNTQFCSQCGQSLWIRCPACQGDCNASQMFCGECGINLQDAVSQSIEEAEVALSRANRLSNNFEFDVAAAILEKLVLSENSHLEAQISSALQSLQELNKHQQQMERAVQQVLETAREEVAARDFASALARLKKIPAGLRTPEVEQLIGQCRETRSELQMLLQEFQERLTSQRPLECLLFVPRLLAIQADLPQVVNSIGALRERACLVARRQIKAHDYASAVNLLEQFPESHQDEALLKLLSYAREQEWLTTDVKRSPYVDRTLVEIIKRLRQSSPENERYAALGERLRRRCGSAGLPEDTETRLPWVLPEGKHHVGCAIHWLGGTCPLRGIELDDVQFPERDRFLKALGLALQGLELAHLTLGLVKVSPPGVLARLADRGRKKPKRAWGIDIGSTSIKAVRMSHDPAESRTAIAEVIEIPRRSGSLARDEAHIEFKKSLEQLRREISSQDERLCFNLPGNRTIGRFFEMPEMASKKQQEAVRIEAQHRFPFTLDDLVWDYEVIASIGPNSSTTLRQQRVAMIAAKKLFVDQFLAALEEVGFSAWLLQADGVALHNLLIHQFFSDRAPAGEGNEGEPARNQGPLALLDVGAAASNLVVSSPQQFWFRTLSMGAHQISSNFVRELKLTHQQAEQLLHEPWRSKRMHRVFEVAAAPLRQLADEVQRSLATCESHAELKQLLGVGGGFRAHGVARYLCHGR